VLGPFLGKHPFLTIDQEQPQVQLDLFLLSFFVLLNPVRFFSNSSCFYFIFTLAVRAVTPVEVVQLTSADLDLLQLDATSTEYMNKLTKERSQARLVSLLKNAHDCATVELNENEVLFVEGDEANHVYLVLSGSIDIIDKKKQNILVTLKKGSLLGETAILTQLPRNATARASGGGGGGGGSRKTTLLKIGSRRFMNLIGTQLRQDLMANKQESLIRSMAQANVEGSTE
jgi:hypothetical protein